MVTGRQLLLERGPELVALGIFHAAGRPAGRATGCRAVGNPKLTLWNADADQKAARVLLAIPRCGGRPDTPW